ncbi:MAG: UDP-N-acetylmuramoyl-L-alanine--D-glutamate ligase [Nitrolancea sp.]
MGIGTRQGGLGVTRYLVAAGADVTVTDLRDQDALKETLSDLQGLPIRYRLGEHVADDFVNADVVVRNPGVPVESPWLTLAREHGASIEMEMTLFFRACPAPIIGITGTKGKTTTSTLCAEILSRHRADAVLAGNMGRSALEALPRIQQDTPVVIELSSWQLEGLGEHGLSPHIAVFTNISPDHLNRYASMETYLDAKLNISRYQSVADWFIVNADDPIVWEHRGEGNGMPVAFSYRDAGHQGAFVEDGTLFWRYGNEDLELIPEKELALRGRHNVMNALAASAAALLAGASPDNVRDGLRMAGGVPDRQEIVAELDGALFVNDTTATTPAAVYAALERFGDHPLVLIAGGSEKGVALEEMAATVASSVRTVLLLAGAATGQLQTLLAHAGAQDVRGPFDSMERAVEEARRAVEPGGVVLLSPGCASFGMFGDEFHRGQAFRDSVNLVRIQAIGEERP